MEDLPLDETKSEWHETMTAPLFTNSVFEHVDNLRQADFGAKIALCF